MSDQELSEQIAAAARDLKGEDDPQSTMETAVRLAVGMVAGAERAGVSLAKRGHTLETPAVSDDVVTKIDLLQAEYDEGPCMDAIYKEPEVYSADLTNDRRWPRWGPKIFDQYGVRSMLCFRLFTSDDTVGALNLYSNRADGFDDDDRDHGLALSAHIAVAVAAAQQMDGLRVAMQTRNVIGQAQGILMERFQLDAQAAFAVLTRVSSHSNRKLRDVANELIATRLTPQPVKRGRDPE